MAIYSPWSDGHNSTYIKCYAESFINCGCRVLILVDSAARLNQLISFEHLRKEIRPAIYSIFKYKHVPILGLIERVFTRRFSFLGIANRLIRRLCKKNGECIPNLVFFPNLDRYFSVLALGEITARLCGGGLEIPWTGHYTFFLESNGLRNRKALMGALQRDKNYRGVILIGDGPTTGPSMEHLVLAHKFPDITNVSICDPSDSFLERIRSAARGRQIVSLLGVLIERKGLGLFIDLVATADSNRFFFVMVGSLGKVRLTPDQQRTLGQIKENRIENCIGHFDFIPEELLNGIMSLSNMIFLVYKDFAGWSNLFTRATQFRRPVLVSQKTQMAARIKSPADGYVIPEDDLAAAIAALTNLFEMRDSRGDEPTYPAVMSGGERLENRISDFLTGAGIVPCTNDEVRK